MTINDIAVRCADCDSYPLELVAVYHYGGKKEIEMLFHCECGRDMEVTARYDGDVYYDGIELHGISEPRIKFWG